MSIYGFTLLRNGIKYDYCFEESLRSLASVSEQLHLALGKSEDGTEESVEKLPKLKIIPTIWDEKLREGGLILSQQTNVALDDCRKDHRNEKGAWGIYLQCDEVFHEEDYQLIKDDIKKAELSGCDVMTFRYLHFWQSHHKIAINKKWYPQEIRAVKLDSEIESWGDAQSFRNFKKTYHSDARIYHYGHVREEDKYKSKKEDILKLYHSDEKMSKYKKREKRFDDITECLNYLGTHPLAMKERIEKFGELFEFPKLTDIYIVDNSEKYSKKFIDSIKAEKVHWVNSLSLVPKEFKSKAVIVNASFFDRVFRPSKVPVMMRSKLARTWPREFLLALKLSEKGIGS